MNLSRQVLQSALNRERCLKQFTMQSHVFQLYIKDHQVLHQFPQSPSALWFPFLTQVFLFSVGSTTSSTALQNESELGDDDVFTVSVRFVVKLKLRKFCRYVSSSQFTGSTSLFLLLARCTFKFTFLSEAFIIN